MVLAVGAGCDQSTQVCGGPGLPFFICGLVRGEAVSYTPPYGVQITGRGVSSVTYSVLGLDGVDLEIWGNGEAWTDSNPHPVAGWLLEPPPAFVTYGEWVCGGSGTITHNADDSVDATLTDLAIVPQCTGGGSASLQADVYGGVLPFKLVPGCWIGFSTNDTSMAIITPSCPQAGVPLALDGMRIIVGKTSDTTVCIGSGASLTLLSDTSSTGGQHLVIDIPSMSPPQSCSTAAIPGDELQMHSAGVPPT